MKSDEKRLHPERLLRHAGWMKRLALRLVTDEAQANDILQETWLAAVRTQPRNPEASKPWLRKVLRNFAFRARKRDQDRHRRERRAARPEKTSTTPDELVERAELHREIVDMVLDLDEPYRSTILLRFFEGLAPKEIARRHDAPVTTVRARLRNALDQLRRRLDRRYGGDRRAWHLAIAPLTCVDHVLPVEVLSSSTAGSCGAASTAVATTSTGFTATTLGLAGWNGAIVMTKKALLTVAAATVIVAGVGVGLVRSPSPSNTRDRKEISRLREELREARARLQEFASAAESGPRASKAGAPTARRKPGPGGDRDGPPEEENPFQDMSAADIVAYLNGAKGDEDPEFRDAVATLCELAREDPTSILPLLSSVKQRGVMVYLCRELVSYGGDEALDAVLGYITDSTASMDLRREAIRSLEGVSPEARTLAQAGLYELMTQRLPNELQSTLCDAYGDLVAETSKALAFQNLMGLLNDPACRVRPEYLIERAEGLGTSEDTSALLSLLGGSWTRETEGAILRAIARTSGSGAILFDLLAEPPEGVARETIADAVAGVAEWASLDNQMVIDAIAGESSQKVRTHLARALVRSGGEGAERLLDLATNPEAGIDPDSLGKALADSRRPELVPTMVELMAHVKDRSTVHRLARAIGETSGREGVDTLLDIIADRKISPDWFYLLSDGIVDDGTPEHATRLFELLEVSPDQNSAQSLLETALQLAGPSGTDRCLSLLRDSANGNVRGAAAEVIGDRGASQHLPELADAFGREDVEATQRHLARAIGRAGPEGVAQLGEMVKSEGNLARRAAILSVLSRYHASESLDVLRDAMARETNEEIRTWLTEVVEKAESP